MNVIYLKIDLMMVQRSDFISFLDLSLTKVVSFSKCSNVKGLMKNLCKINFEQLADFVSIEIS